MNHILHYVLAGVALLLAPACQFPVAHATVRWKGQPPPGGPAPAAAGEAVPASYGSFCAELSYPRTSSVWMDGALLHSGKEKSLRIYLGMQRGVCLADGQVAMDFPVCTGTRKHPTPTGRYRIIEKDANHWSNLYDCPMPFFMRLTYSGIGLHIGQVYRQPASHGCIRLTREACEPLFRVLSCGTRVEIMD